MADWFWMLSVWDSEWSRSRNGRIRLDGDHRRVRAVLGVNLEHPIVTSGFFDA